jgi:hypothetical protein
MGWLESRTGFSLLLLHRELVRSEGGLAVGAQHAAPQSQRLRRLTEKLTRTRKFP